MPATRFHEDLRSVLTLSMSTSVPCLTSACRPPFRASPARRTAHPDLSATENATERNTARLRCRKSTFLYAKPQFLKNFGRVQPGAGVAEAIFGLFDRKTAQTSVFV